MGALAFADLRKPCSPSFLTSDHSLRSGSRGESGDLHQCPGLQVSAQLLDVLDAVLVPLARSPRRNRFNAFPGHRTEKTMALLEITIQWYTTDLAWNLLHGPLHEISPGGNKLMLA